MDKQVEALRLQIEELEYKARYDEISHLCEPLLDDPVPDMHVLGLLGLKTVHFARFDTHAARKYEEDSLVLAREQATPEILVEVLCRASFTRIYELKFDAEMLALAQEALSLARAVNYKRGIAYSTMCLGYSLSRSSSQAEVRNHLDQAISLAQELRDFNLEASACGLLANLYTMTGKFDRARKYNLRALGLFRYTGNAISQCVLLTNLAGSIFSRPYQFRSYDQAIAYNEEALALARQLGYPYGELGALAGLSLTYLIARQAEKALKVLEELTTLTKAYGITFYEKGTLTKLGLAHSYLKNYEEASASLQQCIALADPSRYGMEDVYAYYYLGNVNYKRKRYMDAIGNWRYGLMLHKEQKSARSSYYFSVVSFYITFVLCHVRLAMVTKRLPRVVIR